MLLQTTLIMAVFFKLHDWYSNSRWELFFCSFNDTIYSNLISILSIPPCWSWFFFLNFIQMFKYTLQKFVNCTFCFMKTIVFTLFSWSKFVKNDLLKQKKIIMEIELKYFDHVLFLLKVLYTEHVKKIWLNITTVIF